MRSKKGFEWTFANMVGLILLILLAVIILFSIPNISEAYKEAIKAVFG